MGFLANLVAEKRSTLDYSPISMRDPSLLRVWGGIDTKSGTEVHASTALGVSAVYSCVKIIAWTLASLPLVTYRRLPRGKERATNDPIYDLLHDAPNPEQTSFEWRALTSVHQNLWGAGISEIEFDRRGNPVALWPIPPWCVTPKRTKKGELVYEITIDRDGSSTQKMLWPYQVIVFPALSTSRDSWLSPIGVHRETIGMAIALTDFGASTFGQGTNPAGILSTAGKFSKEMSEKSYRQKMKDSYEGLGNSHRLMLLEDGMKFERVGLPPEDAQYLQTRAFTTREIARMYNVPLHLLQETEKSTSWGSGIEELNSGFISFTLRPYLVQWEQEIRRRLIDDKDMFVEFLIEGLLRGKLADRYAAYATARQWGWFSADDVRELENMNPLPDNQGTSYMNPMNMTPAKYFEKPPQAPAPAEPIDQTDPSEDEGDTTNE